MKSNILLVSLLVLRLNVYIKGFILPTWESRRSRIKICASNGNVLGNESDEPAGAPKKRRKKRSRSEFPITRGIGGTASLFGDIESVLPLSSGLSQQQDSQSLALAPAPAPAPVPAASTAEAYAHGSSEGEITFTVFGEPVPLRRHMLSKGHMYNPSSTEQRNFARACADSLPLAPLQGPVEATLTFYFPRPASHYRTGKFANTLKPGVPSWHSSRKDLDNLVKFVLDSLNGLAYEDDAQIAVIRCAKFYTNFEPRSEIRLRRLLQQDQVEQQQQQQQQTPASAKKDAKMEACDNGGSIEACKS